MSAGSAPLRALLDACVLAQVTAREALFAVATEGLIAPYWSPRIEGEWRSVARRGDAAAVAFMEGDLALARARFPGAVVTPDAALEAALDLPDLDDRHVLAAAVAARADVVVTDNLRDFPRRTLAGHGLRAESADGFLAGLAANAPEAVARAVARMAAAAGDPAFRADPRAALKRARLPRFAKAVARLAE